MACGPNRVPGRCEVPPSNGAPTNTMSSSGSSGSEVRGTPAKVMSGPYMEGVISGSGMVSRLQQRLGGLVAAPLRSGHHSSQPPRHPPVRLAQHLHHGGHQDEPDDGRVDQHRDGEPEPDLL